jgi:hypothetical protein
MIACLNIMESVFNLPCRALAMKRSVASRTWERRHLAGELAVDAPLISRGVKRSFTNGINPARHLG